MATKKSASKDAKQITTIVGEEKAPITTLALGEEQVVTTLVGEQATPHPDFQEATGDGEASTTVVGEQWNSGPVTTVVGEETTIVGEQHVTTLVAGEETHPAGGGGSSFGQF